MKMVIVGLALMVLGCTILLIDQVPCLKSKLPLCSDISFGMCRR